MSTLSYAVADSATMLRRQLRHMRRYLSVSLQLIGMPVVFLLLFVYVFGGTWAPGSAARAAAGPSTSRTSPPGSCSWPWLPGPPGRPSRWPWT